MESLRVKCGPFPLGVWGYTHGLLWCSGWYGGWIASIASSWLGGIVVVVGMALSNDVGVDGDFGSSGHCHNLLPVGSPHPLRTTRWFLSYAVKLVLVNVT